MATAASGHLLLREKANEPPITMNYSHSSTHEDRRREHFCESRLAFSQRLCIAPSAPASFFSRNLAEHPGGRDILRPENFTTTRGEACQYRRVRTKVGWLLQPPPYNLNTAAHDNKSCINDARRDEAWMGTWGKLHKHARRRLHKHAHRST